MSAEGWRQEHFLIALLSSLEHDFDSRLSYFVAAADAGGGASRNRRRLAAGRELLKDVGDALDIAFLNPPEQRSRILEPLRVAVTARLATVTATGFIWKRREPLLPDFNIKAIAAAFESAASETISVLEDSLNPLEVPSASSRSRSPVPRSLDTPSGFERVAVPPVPRPRIEGCPTPTPPTPRPVISGQKTPLPPKARSKGSEPSIPSQTSGPTRAQHIETASSSGSPQQLFSSPAVSIEPAAEPGSGQTEVSSPTELCKLYRAEDLTPVITWCAEAIRQGYRKIISLDEHKVADRDISQTTALVRTALSYGIAIVVLSYIPDSSFASHGRSAVNLWRTVLDSCAYPLAPLPIIVTSKPLGRLGKYSALRYIRNHLFWDHDSLEFDAWTHIDDRQDIVAEINADRFQRAVCWHPKDRRSLLKLCQDERIF